MKLLHTETHKRRKYNNNKNDTLVCKRKEEKEGRKTTHVEVRRVKNPLRNWTIWCVFGSFISHTREVSFSQHHRCWLWHRQLHPIYQSLQLMHMQRFKVTRVADTVALFGDEAVVVEHGWRDQFQEALT